MFRYATITHLIIFLLKIRLIRLLIDIFLKDFLFSLVSERAYLSLVSAALFIYLSPDQPRRLSPSPPSSLCRTWLDAEP